MPARLDEAFGTSLDNIVRNTGNEINQIGGSPIDLASSLSSLESLKNPAFNAHEAHRLKGNTPINQIGGGNSPLNQVGGGNSPINQIGGGCPSLPTVPQRPSLVQPYISDILNSSRADLACQAYTCSPREFEGYSGTPKGYNWDQAVTVEENKAQLTGPGIFNSRNADIVDGPGRGSSLVAVTKSGVIEETTPCGGHLQHIWSCSQCRQQLRDLLSNDDSDETGQVKSSDKGPVGLPQVNLQEVFGSLDLPNLVYHLLLGLALLVLLDTFVRLGRRL